jgi:hypothetical protein
MIETMADTLSIALTVTDSEEPFNILPFGVTLGENSTMTNFQSGCYLQQENRPAAMEALSLSASLNPGSTFSASLAYWQATIPTIISGHFGSGPDLRSCIFSRQDTTELEKCGQWQRQNSTSENWNALHARLG